MSLPATIGILALFYKSSSDTRMVKHGMEIDFLNPGQVPVLAVDQPFYTIAKKLQWMFPDEQGELKCVIMMGGLHIEMAFRYTSEDSVCPSGHCNSTKHYSSGCIQFGRYEPTCGGMDVKKC